MNAGRRRGSGYDADDRRNNEEPLQRAGRGLAALCGLVFTAADPDGVDHLDKPADLCAFCRAGARIQWGGRRGSAAGDLCGGLVLVFNGSKKEIEMTKINNLEELNAYMKKMVKTWAEQTWERQTCAEQI